MDELQNQIEFQLRHRELYHKEKIAEFEDRSGQLIEQERAKYEVAIVPTIGNSDGTRARRSCYPGRNFVPNKV